MRGRFVNVCMALLNILIGALIVTYVLKVPSEITELTVQEYRIISVVEILIYAVFGLTTLLNVIHFFLDIRNGSRRTGYFIAIFAVAFIFMKIWPISIFSFLAGIIILISTARAKWIETNSYTAISIIVLITVAASAIIAASCIYKDLGIYIRDKENENELAYKEDYFRYVTELKEDEEPYICIKKQGKFGYINSNGEVVINFDYDYASPFVSIQAYGKHFDIALVCKEGQSLVILKNTREILTYRSESMNGDYDAKIEELKDIYYNILGQTEEMKFEVENTNDSICKIPKYNEVSEAYTYRYDLNDTYDLIVTQSSMGLGDTYELASKDDLSFRITLNTSALCYDENYLYIYRNGTIPFFDVKNRQQGWFTSYGRKIVLSGNAQILDFFGEYTLIKNHNDKTIYFIDSDGNMVSDTYKEIFICSEDRFIAKNKNNKYVVIDNSFEKVFEGEWDLVDTSLISSGLYVFGTIKGVIDFSDYNYAENMNLTILNSEGNVIANDLQRVYNTSYEISGDKSIAYSERYTEAFNDLKKMKVKFVGDEFYKK